MSAGQGCGPLSGGRSSISPCQGGCWMWIVFGPISPTRRRVGAVLPASRVDLSCACPSPTAGASDQGGELAACGPAGAPAPRSVPAARPGVGGGEGVVEGAGSTYHSAQGRREAVLSDSLWCSSCSAQWSHHPRPPCAPLFLTPSPLLPASRPAIGPELQARPHLYWCKDEYYVDIIY